jgi:hypothetical protein
VLVYLFIFLISSFFSIEVGMACFVLVPVDLTATRDQPALPANSVLVVIALLDDSEDVCGVLLQERSDRLGQQYRVPRANTHPVIIATTKTPLGDPRSAQQRTFVAKKAIRSEPEKPGEDLLQLVPGDLIVDIESNFSRGFDRGVKMGDPSSAGRFPKSSTVNVVVIERLVHVAHRHVIPGACV